jgi:hypothetical protein
LLWFKTVLRFPFPQKLTHSRDFTHPMTTVTGWATLALVTVVAAAVAAESDAGAGVLAGGPELGGAQALGAGGFTEHHEYMDCFPDPMFDAAELAAMPPAERAAIERGEREHAAAQIAHRNTHKPLEMRGRVRVEDELGALHDGANEAHHDLLYGSGNKVAHTAATLRELEAGRDAGFDAALAFCATWRAKHAQHTAHVPTLLAEQEATRRARPTDAEQNAVQQARQNADRIAAENEEHGIEQTAEQTAELAEQKADAAPPARHAQHMRVLDHWHANERVEHNARRLKLATAVVAKCADIDRLVGAVAHRIRQVRHDIAYAAQHGPKRKPYDAGPGGLAPSHPDHPAFKDYKKPPPYENVVVDDTDDDDEE